MNPLIRFASVDGALPWKHLDPAFPTRAASWTDTTSLDLTAGASHFGFVTDGEATLVVSAGTFSLNAGMYFCVPGRGRLHGGAGVVASREDVTTLFSIGGPIEEIGRLKYIDGCSDSLLIAPPVLGDPCLNLLVLPPHTRQRMHDHPSVRVGVVASGVGRCLTPDDEIALRAGMMFSIAPGARHCFHTDDATMRVIAYHPETDFGPQDHDHPMKNRTVNLEEVDDNRRNAGGAS